MAAVTDASCADIAVRSCTHREADLMTWWRAGDSRGAVISFFGVAIEVSSNEPDVWATSGALFTIYYDLARRMASSTTAMPIS